MGIQQFLDKTCTVVTCHPIKPVQSGIKCVLILRPEGQNASGTKKERSDSQKPTMYTARKAWREEGPR